MLGNEPLVSVLMTTYNREKFVRESIESVLKSVYANFELIIVDDCSTDNTISIARSYEQTDSRVKLYLNEKNLGDYHNRNKAASYATGKYIKYVDSDDIIYPHSLSIFVESMETFPDAAVGIMSSISQEAEKAYPVQLSSYEAYRYHFYKRGIFDTGPSALIFRTEKFREIGGFSGKRYVGDMEINLKLASRWPVVKVASSLVFWRQHEGQEIVNGLNSTGYLELQLPMLAEELNKKECPLNEDEKKNIIGYYRKISATNIIKIALVKKQPGKALQLFKQLNLSGKDVARAVFFRKAKY